MLPGIFMIQVYFATLLYIGLYMHIRGCKGSVAHELNDIKFDFFTEQDAKQS
jgi:hypothetical protein